MLGVSVKVIIQARMGSKRFPRKSLHPLNGKPCLAYLIEALEQIFDASSMQIVTSEKLKRSYKRILQQ